MLCLQGKWASNYNNSIEMSLASTAEKIHNEYLAEHEKVKKQLDVEVQRQMVGIKESLNKQYQTMYESEVIKLSDKHRFELAETKKKQWCWLCEAEALYFCCWNSNYCSVECQQKDWPTHRNFCRRKPGDSNGFS